MYLITMSGKCWPFCLGLNVLNFLVELHQGQVSLFRQVCHHCLPWRLSLWQPPGGPGVTSLPAYWRLGLGAPNCNECPNIFLSTCSSIHVLLPLFYVIDCYVMWLCILNEIFVWTQVVNKLLLLMAWCRQATNHCLSQCCPKLMSPYGITMRQWVNALL